MTTEQLRSLFPALARRAYLNCAGQGPLNLEAGRAMARLTKLYMTEAYLSIEEWARIQREAKEKFARLLLVHPGELAFMPNTTTGIQVATRAIPWQEGDNLVVQECAFPCLVYPFRFSPPRGVEVRWAKSEPRDLVDEIKGLADARTRAVFVDWVHFATGQMLDLAGLSELAEERGFFLVVDGTQGLGPVFPDFDSLRVDFWAGSLGKWLLGLEGSGFLYVNRKTLEALEPTDTGWLSGEYRTFSELFPSPEPFASAERYEAGTRCMMAIAGFSGSLNIFLEMGRERIISVVRELTEAVFAGAEKRGLLVATYRDRHAGIVSFRPPGDPEAYYNRLTEAGVVVSLRQGHIRVSPHFFNIPEEAERVFL